LMAKSRFQINEVFGWKPGRRILKGGIIRCEYPVKPTMLKTVVFMLMKKYEQF
jgi:hypothetical protein